MSPVQQKSIPRAVTAAFPILLISLFLIFSALFEVLPGIRLMRPQLLLAGIGLIMLVISGQVVKVLMTPIARSLLIFTAWFLVCVPFAIWIGGSLTVLINNWYKSLLMFVLTAGLLTTVTQAKKLFHAIGYAVGLLAVIAILKHTYFVGRLMVPDTRYANSNDLAVSLLVGLIFLSYSFLRGTRRDRVIAVVLSAPVLLALAKTGSRAAFLGIGMLFLFGFFQASAKNKVKMAIAVPLLLCVVAVILPSTLRQRYFTLFTVERGSNLTAEEADQLGSAAGSSEARLKLLEDSLTITLRHPLFGVGPGNFTVEQNNMASARGEFGMWHVTHNSYTQVSSEMGIIGLILYVAFLYQTYKVLTSVVRSRGKGATWNDLRALASILRAAIVVMATVAFFDSFVYNADIPILAGLAAALGSMAVRLRAADRSAITPALAPLVPVPQPQHELLWTP